MKKNSSNEPLRSCSDFHNPLADPVIDEDEEARRIQRADWENDVMAHESAYWIQDYDHRASKGK